MADAAQVWVVDDDRSVRFVLAAALGEAGYRVTAFADAAEVLAALAAGRMPDLLLTDVRMPGDSGLVLLDKLKAAHPRLPVIVMSAHTDVASTAGAFRGGAQEFLSKPFDMDDAVALVQRALPADVARTAPPAPAPVEGEPALVGQAPAMRELFRAIGRLAQVPLSVLITGETGTGKELVARALHRESPRAARPFVALNTAAIPADLLESELFGHEAGAFTGATKRQVGRFEQANGGTLFLDEIGDMPFELQTRLLRVLSDGQFYRVCGHSPLRSNVRVIAATHQNLEERVRQGVFREDLFHRLNVIRLRLPPLRERREDIPALARHFLQRSATELGVEPKRLSDAALAVLTQFDFPGNVRQLENICHWLSVMAPSQVVEPKDLPDELQPGYVAAPASASFAGPAPVAPSTAPLAAAPATATSGGDGWLADMAADARARLVAGETDVWDALTKRFEAQLILTALDVTRGRRIEAAQKLGIGRNTITRKIQELGLDV